MVCLRRCGPVSGPLFFVLCAALCVLVLVLGAPAARAGTLTKADVEAMFPPPQIVGEKLAHLPVWPVFVRTGQGPVLQNHVFETIDLEPVAGYGGKPINLLVVLDRDGGFVTSRLLSHTEPIFRSEQGIATLTRFGQQYQGLTVHHQIQVLGPKAQRAVTPHSATLHGIVAGTVTAMAMNRSIMESAAQVAQAHADPAALAEAKRALEAGPNDRHQRTGFNGLASTRLVQAWTVENRVLEARFAGSAGAGRDAEGVIRPKNAAIDLWFAWAGMPQVGRNLLSPPRWQEVRAEREKGGVVLMVLDGSRYPLQGSEAAGTQPGSNGMRLRGASLTLEQGGREFALELLPWQQGLRMSGQHSGVSAGSVARYYRVRAAADGRVLDPWQPVQMKLAVWRGTWAATATNGAVADDRATVVLTVPFEIPDAAAFRPELEVPAWMEPWSKRSVDLAILAIGLLVLSAALLAQRRLVATRRRLTLFRVAALVFTLGFIGWFAQGQLTIVSLTALVEALVAGRSTTFLLLDPMAVVLWAFTLVTLFVWGRGTFCGWLCPFGALQELIARATQALGWAQRRVPVRLDLHLKRVKYVVLAVLLVGAAVSPTWAEWLVEVEPFKTSISLYFQRSWPYVLWAGLCLALGTVVYRGYCRYICPLGAALAVLGLLRLWGWSPRRAECGTPCQTCRHRCEYQAIEKSGRIAYDECFQCLDCVQVHDDSRQCLPLVLHARGKVIPIGVLTGAGAPAPGKANSALPAGSAA